MESLISRKNSGIQIRVVEILYSLSLLAIAPKKYVLPIPKGPEKKIPCFGNSLVLLATSSKKSVIALIALLRPGENCILPIVARKISFGIYKLSISLFFSSLFSQASRLLHRSEEHT